MSLLSLFIIAYNWKTLVMLPGHKYYCVELCEVCSAPFCTLIDFWTAAKIRLWKFDQRVYSSAFKQMVHFYPKSQVTVPPLALPMSAKPDNRLFVTACVFVRSSEKAGRLAEGQTAGQTVSHLWSCKSALIWRGRQTQWPERGPASETTCERAGMYSPLHCGFVSVGKECRLPDSQDTVRWGDVKGWGGGGGGGGGGGRHNFRESECKVRRRVWITAVMLSHLNLLHHNIQSSSTFTLISAEIQSSRH